ncbi:arylsulfatase [Rubripirellula lacrimiformis]|uniref:arylsulfatase n=1 Tax=Rubripirellula lacrimiformis TaxID=1930273 RepID=UPI001FE48A0C|nr:arylsulfatase [Rubripirellula lacrimiformis]
MIVTDDQGYGDMSCHGNPWLKTPHLDQLASESVRLEDYHVDPVCTPTRAALMTGRYCTRVGAWAVVQGRQLLQRDESTIANVFADAGYRTGMFGKWHLGDAHPYAPRFRGFQDVVCHLAGGADEIGNPVENDFFDDTYYRNGVPEKFDGYCTDVFFSELQRFVTQESDAPFFAYLPLNAMHGPHHVAKKYSDPFLEQGHNEARSKFFGMIANFDENLGRFSATLKRKGMDQNTIVIFMGDNGTAQGSDGNPANDDGFNAGMRGKKGSTYEGGHRVACFVRWPNKLEPGRRIHQLTTHRDWLPTLIDLCKLEPSKSAPHQPFDGRSIAPLLLGEEVDWPQRTVFVQRQADQPSLEMNPGRRSAYPKYAVLTEQWRMVNGELYHHGDDPGQTQDLSQQHPEVVEQLFAQYEKHYADVFAEGEPYARFEIGTMENPTRLTVRDWHPDTIPGVKGRVIWKQEQLGDDKLFINGFWAVHFARTGRYQIRLSRFPGDAIAAMKADSATLQIGDQTFSQTIRADESSATFEVELAEGDALLQSWLVDAETGNQRGAYFVDAKLIGN